jgi:hypothetical protein
MCADRRRDEPTANVYAPTHVTATHEHSSAYVTTAYEYAPTDHAAANDGATEYPHQDSTAATVTRGLL